VFVTVKTGTDKDKCSEDA